jgi:predicted Zn-ribbon and HTH transcriptional regulator
MGVKKKKQPVRGSEKKEKKVIIPVRKIRCPHCRWLWTPRVKYPAECPHCKRRLGWPGRR